MTLAPGDVVDVGDHGLDLLSIIAEAVVEANRIEEAEKGLSRWAGRAKSPRGVPAYSKSPRPSETEKLMWRAGWPPIRERAL
jgi:hypothetical protein